MLQWIRQGVGSWIIKVFLGLLIVSFAVWGIGDIFSGRTMTTAIKAGNVEVSEVELGEAFKRELRRMQETLGPSITAEQAIAFGLDRQVLADTVSRAVLDARAQGLDMAASDETIRRSITEIKAFQGPAGFDRIQFESILRQNNLTEARFVAQLKSDLKRRQLVEAVVSGTPVPSALGEALHIYRGERRVAELFVIPASSIKGITAPDQATLEAYHTANAGAFTAPEYRKLTLLEAEPADIAKTLEVTEADLQAAYDERIDEFVTPEKRDVLQIVTTDEAKARTAQQRIAAGEDFIKVAGDVAGLKETDLALGEIEKDNLPTDLGNAVFALPAKKVSEPLKSSFGFHVFFVRSISPGVKLSLNDVKDRVASQVRLSRAGDRIATLSNELQDALAGGTSLEDAAQKFGATIRVIESTNAGGKDARGGTVPLPPYESLLAEAFTAATGADGDLRETATGGIVVVRVDSVTPATLKPLDTVRAEVTAAWTAEERQRRALAAAEKQAEAARAGKSLADLAKANGSPLSATLPLTRSTEDADPNVAGVLLGKLFAAQVGDVMTAATPKGDGAVVARLKTVLPVDLKAEAIAVQSTRDRLGRNLANDLLSQFQASSQEKVGLTTDETLIQRALAGDSRG